MDARRRPRTSVSPSPWTGPCPCRASAGGAATPVGYLGVTTADPTDRTRAAVIVTVEAGSPAATAGLAPGDLLTHVAGKVVAGAAELAGVVSEHEPGETVDVSVLRRGQPLTVPVTLGTRRPG